MKATGTSARRISAPLENVKTHPPDQVLLIAKVSPWNEKPADAPDPTGRAIETSGRAAVSIESRAVAFDGGSAVKALGADWSKSRSRRLKVGLSEAIHFANGASSDLGSP